MGCKASKPEMVAVEQVEASPKHSETANDKFGSTTTASTPPRRQPSEPNNTASTLSLQLPSGPTAPALPKVSEAKNHHQSATAAPAATTTTTQQAASILKHNSNESETRKAVLFQLLVHAQRLELEGAKHDMTDRILTVCGADPNAARYQHPTTKATPLHLAVQLLDSEDGQGYALNGSDVLSVIEGLVQVYPNAVAIEDINGHIPLHYAISPTNINSDPSKPAAADEADSWGPRSAVLQLLLATDMECSLDYLMRNDVVYNKSVMLGGVTPLYRAIQALPDDFEPFSVTYEFISILRDACGEMVGVGNKGDGDKPLALLYRRFTRQFDLAEKFFEGDNSREEVVHHRFRYKTAAANTWKIIECLLRPEAAPNGPSASSPLRNKKSLTSHSQEWRLVHRAVQVETPPDLLRYIVETNAEDLTKADASGNLPLHYAARSKPVDHGLNGTSFPSFYAKYVVDELLYKFPEAAGMMDADGKYPLTLAVEAGKQWIGGGVKSLFDAFPGAMEQIDIKEREALRSILSDDGFVGEEKYPDTVIRDEHHDSIMVVQQENVDIAEVITRMWAHEEDAGVQMLACVAVCRIARQRGHNNKEYLLRIALSSVAAVVNAMKAHPNEVIVQEKACQALKDLASTDGQQEISFVASGAVAAIVGAMQAHVSDPNVQEEACGALAEIINAGGSDRATIVASVSGLTALVNALAAHPDDVGVQRNACLALDAMTSFADANLPELPRMQTEPLLDSARQKFPRECGEAADAVISRLVE